jgi:hypothetical protein
MNLMCLLFLMTVTSWIPRRQEAFAAFCAVWRTGLGDPAQAAAFGWPQAEVAAVLDAIDGFLAALEAYLENDSSFNRVMKNEKREKAMRAMEKFANRSIRYNDLMTEPDKNRYGIFTRKPPHRVTVPATVPVLMPRAGNPREIVVPYRDRDSARRGKPRHVHGIEIRWGILDHAPTSIEELINVTLDTRSPLRLVFEDKYRGKRVYFVGCWVIEREGEKGKFGEFSSVLVP